MTGFDLSSPTSRVGQLKCEKFTDYQEKTDFADRFWQFGESEGPPEPPALVLRIVMLELGEV